MLTDGHSERPHNPSGRGAFGLLLWAQEGRTRNDSA
jgi:hypothetical protein